MLTTTSRSWWVVLSRGVVAILFGLGALIVPTAAAGALAWVFGAYALVGGLFALAAAFQLSTHDDRWWTLIASGALGVVVGIIALFMTGAALISLVYVIGVWAIITGVLELIAAVRLRTIISKELYLAISGIVSIVLGILLFAWPITGVIVVTYIIAWYALIYGFTLVGLALRLRHHGGTHTVSHTDQPVV